MTMSRMLTMATLPRSAACACVSVRAYAGVPCPMWVPPCARATARACAYCESTKAQFGNPRCRVTCIRLRCVSI